MSTRSGAGVIDMLCPECGEENNRVIDTDNSSCENVIARVRKCMCCGFAWVTEEKVKDRFKKQETAA